MRRHEVLRTSLRQSGGLPEQKADPSAALCVLVADVGGGGVEPRRALARQLIAGDIGRGFDLSRAPLLRVLVVRLAPRRHLALLNMHHAVSDGWSVGMLRKGVQPLYRPFVAGFASPLAELPLQYADYALWQRRWLQGEVLERQLGYWRAHLAGAPALLELAADRPRPAVQSHRGAAHSFALAPALGRRL